MTRDSKSKGKRSGFTKKREKHETRSVIQILAHRKKKDKKKR